MKKLFKSERGAVALITAMAFLAIALPLITAALGLNRTLSMDASVKTDILKRQYSSAAGGDYGSYLLNYVLGFADSLQVGVPYVFTFTLNGKTITVTITLVDPGQRPELQTTKWADVVMALDNSSTIDTLELMDLKNATGTIVDRFELWNSEGRIRIGMTRFGNSSDPLVSMTDVDDHDAIPPDVPLHVGINLLVQGGSGSSSNMVQGLNGAANQFNTGLGDRADVPNIILFITDGDDVAESQRQAVANASASTGAEVFAVGVGSTITVPTLDAIATDDDPSDPDYNPADPNAMHRFYTSDFSGLYALIDGIVEAIYKAARNRVFVISSQVEGQSPTETVVVLPP